MNPQGKKKIFSFIPSLAMFKYQDDRSIFSENHIFIYEILQKMMMEALV